MKIQIEITLADGKKKLTLIDPSEAVQQFTIAKFFGFCRDTSAAVKLVAQKEAANEE